MDQIEVAADPDLTAHRSEHPRHIPSVTTVRADGQEYQTRVDCPLGHPENPMSDEQIRGKLADNCRGYLSDEQVESCIKACRSVADLDSVDPVVRTLII